jgi:hypothetical protein
MYLNHSTANKHIHFKEKGKGTQTHTHCVISDPSIRNRKMRGRKGGMGRENGGGKSPFLLCCT